MNIFDNYLKRHQRMTVQKVIRKYGGRSLLALDMGLGKTVTALSLCEELEEKTLVVCPASLKYNWVTELKKFWPKKKAMVCSGQTPPSSGRKEIDFFIINYEILQFWKKFFIKEKIQLLVCDESHFIKNKDAKRTKAAISISQTCEHVLLLTGTPITSKPIDLWSQLQVIDKDLFPSWLLFAKRYNGCIKSRFGWTCVRATRTKELNRILKDTCMIRMKKEEVMKDLPEKSKEVILTEIENRKEYEQAEQDIISWIQRHNTGGLNIEKTKKAEAAVKFQKLQEISAVGKLPAFISWANENSQNEKLVIFCTNKSILSALSKKLKNCILVSAEMSSEERQEATEKFQKDDKVRIFLSTCRVAGTGLTLTASHRPVFIQLPDTSALLEQSIDRCHRIGQNEKVIATIFLAHDTIEERVARLLDVKKQETEAVVDGKETSSEDLLQELIKDFMKEGKK